MQRSRKFLRGLLWAASYRDSVSPSWVADPTVLQQSVRVWRITKEDTRTGCPNLVCISRKHASRWKNLSKASRRSMRVYGKPFSMTNARLALSFTESGANSLPRAAVAARKRSRSVSAMRSISHVSNKRRPLNFGPPRASGGFGLSAVNDSGRTTCWRPSMARSRRESALAT